MTTLLLLGIGMQEVLLIGGVKSFKDGVKGIEDDIEMSDKENKDKKEQ